MKTFRVVPALLLALGPVAASAASTTGLCDAAERTYFSCATTRERSIALCGVPGKGVQYRFGRPGAVDLAYPASATDGPSTMFFSHYMRFRKDRTEVRFDNEGVRYVVFDDRDDGSHEAGVTVVDRSGKEREVACKGPVVNRLGELKPLLRCDADNALNLGSCP